MLTSVVTGASGHVGANLVRALLVAGERVRALVHRDQRALQGLDFEPVRGDVRDTASLDRLIRDGDTVYHAAALISLLWHDWDRVHEVNVQGTRNVAEACLRNGARRLIHFSSSDALDLGGPGTIDEDTPLADPDDARRFPAYDRSKAAAEGEVRANVECGLEAVVIRPTAILGPHDYRPSHQGQMLISLAEGQMPGLVEGGYDWVDVRDVVAAATRAAEVAPPGARYIVSGHWSSLCDLAGMLEEISGTRAPRIVCPMGLARLAAPFATAWARLAGQRAVFTRVSLHALRGGRSFSYARAAADLGYRPRELRETLRDTYAWFADTGRLPSAPG